MKRIHHIHSLVLILIMGFFLPACGQVKKKTSPESVADSLKKTTIKEWNKTIPGNFSTQTKSTFDNAEVAVFLKEYPLFRKYAGSIRRFYDLRHNTYAWFDEGHLIEQASNLFDRVVNVRSEGVYKEIPYKSTLYRMMDNVSQKGSQTPDIDLELMLTAQYFVFANTVWQGMSDAASRAVNWYLPRKKISYEVFLDSLLKMPQAKVKGVNEPVFRQYELLRAFLKKYEDLDNAGKWFAIVPDKKAYKPGDSSVVITQIKQRLFDLGDFTGNISDAHFDDALQTAVKQFQSRNGIPDDGLVSRGTLAELNVPYKTRIKQIMVNMERSRWVPINLITANNDYLGINIPEFKIHVYHGDSLLWSCNVVVGKVMKATAIFSGEVKYVVFRPYWNVPPSIVRNEILKGIHRNGNYLEAHHMEVTGYREGLPVIRQRPGPDNSLGLVKFLFPNIYNIYLHDTPSKSLFAEPVRTFSPGCIRISEPVRMAEFLLRKDAAWNPEKIADAMNNGTERYVTLKDKVPIFIAYFTAFVDRSGMINFRKDIYNKDERLARMLLNDNAK
jgi:murein L,D-transpeptidase YcbB/YkuD